MRTLFCIVNAHARAARKRPQRIESFEQSFSGTPHQLKVSHSLEETRQTLERWKDQNPEILMICGGDGTLHHTLNLLIEIWDGKPLPSLLPLPGGTMNVVFKSISQNKTTASLNIEKIIAGLNEMQTKKLSLLKCNDHHGFIWGIGGFANFILEYKTSKDPTPAWAIYLILKTALLEILQKKSNLFRIFQASVSINHLAMDSYTYKTISCASISHLGFGFHLYPDAKVPGQLGAFLLKKSPLRILPYFWGLLKNRRLCSSAFLQLPVNVMHVKTVEPVTSMMDGEIVDLTDYFMITAGPTMDVLV